VTDAPTIPALAMAASSQSFKFKSHGLVRFGAWLPRQCRAGCHRDCVKSD